MGQLDQFAKDTFAVEAASITHGGVSWQLPPELGMSEVRLDGLLRVHDPSLLTTLAPPWSLVDQADEIALEVKMQGDHSDLLSFDRASLRRLARQVQRREDPGDHFDGESSLWYIASHVPAVIKEAPPGHAHRPGLLSDRARRTGCRSWEFPRNSLTRLVFGGEVSCLGVRILPGHDVLRTEPDKSLLQEVGKSTSVRRSCDARIPAVCEEQAVL